MVYINNLFLIFITISLSSPICVIDKNFCLDCNSMTNLCIKCKYDVLKPDNEGGCLGNNLCVLGKNYCDECDYEGKICTKF